MVNRMLSLVGNFRPKGSTKISARSTTLPFNVWAAKPLKRVFRDELPRDESIGRPLELSCARNEAEGCVFGIRADMSIHVLRLDATDLTSGKNVISKANIQLGFIGFVPVPKNTSDTPVEELERLAPFEAPDPILDRKYLDIMANETQPCHFKIYVPKDTAPGDYHGQIKISSHEGEIVLNVLLHIYPIELPDHRSLYVTNWFSVDKIASVHNVELWSEEFWRVLEAWIALMSEYRQNVFWVPLDTITVSYKDEHYRFDFSVFDRYIELLMRYKVDKIEITHVAHFKQWGGKEIALKDFRVIGPEGVKTENGAKILPYLLPILEKHLAEIGWLENALIHVADEPTEDGLKAWTNLSKFVREYAPRLKRIDAIETIGFEGQLEVWVPTLHHFNDWMDHYLEAMKDGFKVWFYTCCNPKGSYPNRFLDYPLLDTRVLHWINYAYGLKGYLHWGFNWWRDDAFGEPDPSLPPGDTHIAYPGQNCPLSSLRLEAMRDGLEDYEYLKLLEDEIASVRIKLVGHALSEPFERRALEICRRVVPSITGHARDTSVLLEAREAIVKEITEIRKRPFALVLTEPSEWKPVVKNSTTIIVKGVCEDGSRVDVNGKQTEPQNGYFSTYTYPRNGGEVTVRIIKDGFEKVITRRFSVIT